MKRALALLVLPLAVPSPQPFSLAARQAKGISTVVVFLDAYNRRDLGIALAQFTDDPDFVRYVGGNDCDYRHVKVARFVGRDAVAAWLRRRFADRDHLTLSTIRPLDGRGAAVDYARRTSDTLRALGFPDGIQAGLATKVGFTTEGPVRITQFANAGADEGCRPRAGPGAADSLPALTSQQAREVSVLVRFVGAFNARRLKPALGLLRKDVKISDCDFENVRVVSFSGHRGAERWLRRRFADHDRLTIGRVANEDPNFPTGALAVDYARRTSDTLRALGFGAGIVPKLGTKVVFAKGKPVRIAGFGNGPLGGSREFCRP
jgi:hypothetical protein